MWEQQTWEGVGAEDMGGFRSRGDGRVWEQERWEGVEAKEMG